MDAMPFACVILPFIYSFVKIQQLSLHSVLFHVVCVEWAAIGGTDRINTLN